MPAGAQRGQPAGRPGLVARAQRTGTAPVGFSVGLVTLFAALATLVAAPSILTGAPQIGMLLVALAMTITLLADLLRPDLGRYAMWLRLVSVVVAVTALALLTVQFL